MISFLLWEEGAHRGKEAGMLGRRKSHRGCLSAATGGALGGGPRGPGLIFPTSSAWPGHGSPSQACSLTVPVWPIPVLR